MIVAEHVADYLGAVAGPRSDVMAEMEALGERDHIPIVPLRRRGTRGWRICAGACAKGACR